MTEHLTDDLLIALVLQETDPPDQERLSAHLAGCATCRAEYHALEDTLGHTLTAAPAIAPPAGFSGRVVEAMGLSPEEPAAASRPAGARPRTAWLAAAAALAIGLGLGVGGTLAVIGTGPPAVAPAEPAASALVTRTGETVGSAGTVTIDGRRMLVLTVTSGRPGMTYECILIAPDGSRTSGGTWTLDDGYEGENASGTWVVPLTDAVVVSVELVAPSGKVWSTARF